MTETIFTQTAFLALPGRALVGALLALAVAGLAWRSGSLRRNGFVAAAVFGTLCATAGWSWAALLVVYFVAAAGLSRLGSREKEARAKSVVSKSGGRDAAQVFANGGVYSIAAVLTVVFAQPYLTWGAIGALAAASSDTWGTEIGLWVGGVPRSILTRTYVRPGQSGGVTIVGMLGSIAGAGWVGVVAVALGFPRGLGIASLVAGVGGSITDSVLGATVQEGRWCDGCGEPTERAVHPCGAHTRHVSGIRRLDNDVVNLLSTFAGFLLGAIVYCIANGFVNWSAID